MMTFVQQKNVSLFFWVILMVFNHHIFRSNRYLRMYEWSTIRPRYIER